jgi:hypothetical protein
MSLGSDVNAVSDVSDVNEISGVSGVIEVPDEDEDFMCVITGDYILDPVVAADGFCYEKSAIQRWLRDHNTSPKTNEVMGKSLNPCFRFKKQLEAFYKKYPEKKPPAPNPVTELVPEFEQESSIFDQNHNTFSPNIIQSRHSREDSIRIQRPCSREGRQNSRRSREGRQNSRRSREGRQNSRRSREDSIRIQRSCSREGRRKQKSRRRSRR